MKNRHARGCVIRAASGIANEKNEEWTCLSLLQGDRNQEIMTETQEISRNQPASNAENREDQGKDYFIGELRGSGKGMALVENKEEPGKDSFTRKNPGRWKRPGFFGLRYGIIRPLCSL